MRVTDPIDDVDLRYAIEEILLEAHENGMEIDDMQRILEAYAVAAEGGQYPFNEF